MLSTEEYLAHKPQIGFRGNGAERCAVQATPFNQRNRAQEPNHGWHVAMLYHLNKSLIARTLSCTDEVLSRTTIIVEQDFSFADRNLLRQVVQTRGRRSEFLYEGRNLVSLRHLDREGRPHNLELFCNKDEADTRRFYRHGKPLPHLTGKTQLSWLDAWRLDENIYAQHRREAEAGLLLPLPPSWLDVRRQCGLVL